MTYKEEEKSSHVGTGNNFDFNINIFNNQRVNPQAYIDHCEYDDRHNPDKVAFFFNELSVNAGSLDNQLPHIESDETILVSSSISEPTESGVTTSSHNVAPQALAAWF